MSSSLRVLLELDKKYWALIVCRHQHMSFIDGEVTFNLNFNERERYRHVIGGRCHRKYRNKVTRYHCVETPTRAIGNIKICEMITKCSYQFSWYFYLFSVQQRAFESLFCYLEE